MYVRTLRQRRAWAILAVHIAFPALPSSILPLAPRLSTHHTTANRSESSIDRAGNDGGAEKTPSLEHDCLR